MRTKNKLLEHLFFFLFFPEALQNIARKLLHLKDPSISLSHKQLKVSEKNEWE